ncbi:hypothetical protein BDR05DRAFT_966322 [Suillus weaverae]|nr:hypothetical protein BDR05DRAFT_966322 [Suillus weaverae]
MLWRGTHVCLLTCRMLVASGWLDADSLLGVMMTDPSDWRNTKQLHTSSGACHFRHLSIYNSQPNKTSRLCHSTLHRSPSHCALQSGLF